MHSDDVQTAIQEIEILLNNAKTVLGSYENSDIQYEHTLTSVRNFIGQVLGHINGNSDLPEVNKILADSLLEVQRYLLDRPRIIRENISSAKSRCEAYQECIELLKSLEEPEEENVSSLDRVFDKLDVSGNLPPRSTGGRPEKLRDIRRAQEILRSGDIQEVDI